MSVNYLFVRLLTACNAGCWFCDFAHSKDKYRLQIEEYEKIIFAACESGVEFIRFTGGETLLHKDLPRYIKLANEKGIKTSIITNGLLLEKYAGQLFESGLDQVVVSIDEIDDKHDEIRNTNKLFTRAVAGIKKSRELGIKVRINTVCGPHNYETMPVLQKLFTQLGISYWELSALKLEESIVYEDKKEKIDKVIQTVYSGGENGEQIIPFGKIWCGNTLEEQNEYFFNSIPPRPTGRCHIVKFVRYYDPENRSLYMCSLTPHRGISEKLYKKFQPEEELAFDSPEIKKIEDYFYEHGPTICKGCSSTAAGCSDYLNNQKHIYEWIY